MLLVPLNKSETGKAKYKMFYAVFRNTVKSLLRSWIFWIAFMVFAVVALPSVWERPEVAAGHEYLLPTSLSIRLYYQHVGNLFQASFLSYALPVFTVISTVLVLNRDYGDQFFEIEKAADIKPMPYLMGRLSAVISLQMLVVLVLSGLLLHAYVIGWGGVEEMPLGTYLLDSTTQVVRWMIAAVLPCILFCVGLTFMIGSIFRSGFAAALGGFGNVILYLALRLYYVPLVMQKGFLLAKVYFHYLSYRPNMLTDYLVTFEFGGDGLIVRTSLGEALICIGLLGSFFAIFSVVSYWRIRKREV